MGYRSALDAPIEIHATRPGSSEITSWVYPDEIDSTTERMAQQGYTVVSVTGHSH